ncbi:aldo/keto reductase [Terrabacter sp. GCM10028922]|uniref:aldo/keto reductase n=1 Tax=Terrabacter sp. GCM10028922 TaxID=3273428 RepID=UPI003621ACAC
MTSLTTVTRRIGGLEVGAIGLGCMNLSHAYGTAPSEREAERLLLTALEVGVVHLDTAALYGFGANEELVGRVLGQHRDRFVLASKCGMTGVDGKRVVDGRPETIRATAEAALRRLRTDVIDVYYLHRLDPAVPIEESVGVMAQLVEAGSVRHIGLSEASAPTVRRAHAVHPIAALQNEYSLWTRNPELGTDAVCRELGIALVAFSPLGRGLLTSSPPVMSALPAKDLRHGMPRFQGAAYAANLALQRQLAELADEAGCTPAQLALAWLLDRGDHVIPIPGTRSVDHLRENVRAATVPIAADVLRRAGELVNERTVTGRRYSAAAEADIDTEAFPQAG